MLFAAPPEEGAKRCARLPCKVKTVVPTSASEPGRAADTREIARPNVTGMVSKGSRADTILFRGFFARVDLSGDVCVDFRPPCQQRQSLATVVHLSHRAPRLYATKRTLSVPTRSWSGASTRSTSWRTATSSLPPPAPQPLWGAAQSRLLGHQTVFRRAEHVRQGRFCDRA